MNCDEAFDALTSGCARESDELERHLSLCPRCRQMRDVLSPALAMFDPFDDVVPRESPGSTHNDPAESIRKQFLSVEAVQMARETAQRLSAIGRKDDQTRLRREAKWLVVQVAAAVAAVVMVFTLFAPIASGPGRLQSGAGAAGPMPVVQCLWKDKKGIEESKLDSHAVVSSCVACHFESPMRVR